MRNGTTFHQMKVFHLKGLHIMCLVIHVSMSISLRALTHIVYNLAYIE